MKPGAFIVANILACVVALAPSAAAPAYRAAAGTRISIVDYAFDPADQTITVGDTVTWQNDGSEPHNVVDAEGAWESPALISGQTYAFTVNAPGTYTYFCTIHSGMLGTITAVEPPQRKVYIPWIQR